MPRYIICNYCFEQTKHIELDCHITWEKVEDGIIATPYVSTRAQIADMFTKTLCKTRLGLLCNKLGLYDINTLQLEGEHYGFKLGEKQ